jgi:unsaturated rhamnogalacturonyl hydrolase
VSIKDKRATAVLLFSMAVAACSSGGDDQTGAGGSAVAGSAGSPGVAGSTGSAGSTGAAGTTGVAGAPGAGGTTAVAGATGAAGTTGVAGMAAAGNTGSAGTGVAGATAGSAGATGVAGNGGASAGRGGAAAGAGGSAGAGTAGAAGGATALCPATPTDFQTWPSGKGPLDIGKLATNDFKSHTNDTYGGAGYSLIFTWFGALRFTKVTGDTTNNMSLITAFEPYATGSKTVDNGPTATVDSRAFGDLPLEIFQLNADARCKTLGLARADTQWAMTDSSGITKDARYWADDMYMITALQVEAYRVTKDVKYLDRAAKTMLSYHAALQQSDGLFWHTRDSKAYWGRANGWVAAGMAELLLDLPAGTNRTMILAGFKKMMDGLLPLQITSGADDGMWRQVLDLTSAPAESSCTAMFSFALTTAVKNGWLTDAKYAAAARKGWLGVANKTDSTGKLDKICPGTGAASSGTLQSQQQFYATIALGKGDLHGQAPLLWLAAALLRTDCPGVR